LKIFEFQEILDFWFLEIEPAKWWKKDTDFDADISERFGHVHRAASQGELFKWRAEPRGRLAEIIVLDQFSRNMFRNRKESFAFDAMALVLSQEAVSLNIPEQLSTQECAFLLMPYMHSESKVVHIQALDLFEKYAPENLDFEIRHKEIVDRFGRYPHRNEILGRVSSQEEVEFLKQKGSSF